MCDSALAQALGRRLRQAREAAELTPVDVAVAVGCDEAHVRRWERGDHVPHLETLYRIGEALGVSLVDLLPARPRVACREPAEPCIE